MTKCTSIYRFTVRASYHWASFTSFMCAHINDSLFLYLICSHSVDKWQRSLRSTFCFPINLGKVTKTISNNLKSIIDWLM